MDAAVHADVATVDVAEHARLDQRLVERGVEAPALHGAPPGDFDRAQRSVPFAARAGAYLSEALLPDLGAEVAAGQVVGLMLPQRYSLPRVREREVLMTHDPTTPLIKADNSRPIRGKAK